MNGLIIAEYVWIGGRGPWDLRSKARSLAGPVSGLKYIPDWSYDGSSCSYAHTDNSDIILKPVRVYIDPFRGSPHLLVLCSDTYTTRSEVCELYEQVSDCYPLFGFEQEYVLLADGNPLSVPGVYGNYCGVMCHPVGRNVMDLHYAMCLYAGVCLFGVNVEVMPGQFEFQTGPSSPVQAADDLVIARYILLRIAEHQELRVCYIPKPFPDQPASGLHTNYSDISIRRKEPNAIQRAINQLGSSHNRVMNVYGDNSLRLSGYHETSRLDVFSWGLSDRTASVRIPPSERYIEDRRPAADACPYAVVLAILSSIHSLDLQQ